MAEWWEGDKMDDVPSDDGGRRSSSSSSSSSGKSSSRESDSNSDPQHSIPFPHVPRGSRPIEYPEHSSDPHLTDPAKSRTAPLAAQHTTQHNNMLGVPESNNPSMPSYYAVNNPSNANTEIYQGFRSVNQDGTRGKSTVVSQFRQNSNDPEDSRNRVQTSLRRARNNTSPEENSSDPERSNVAKKKIFFIGKGKRRKD